jgi:hypothetical protein
MVGEDTQIPLLFDTVGAKPACARRSAARRPGSALPPKKPPTPCWCIWTDELRTAAQLIMQDVINDFAPHIETEIKRRLDARMERLLSQHQSIDIPCRSGLARSYIDDPRPSLQARSHFSSPSRSPIPAILAGFPELMPTRVPPRMDKTYQPHAIETSWYQTWEVRELFRSARRGRVRTPS